MRTHALVAVAVVVGVALPVASGCPSEITAGGGNCGGEQQCAAGQACQDGVCIESCNGDDDCERGICDTGSGRCVDCFASDQCPDGLVCNDFTNRCVAPLTGCTGDGDCGGQRCDTIKGACVECLSEGDCPAGALCDLLTSTCAQEASCVTDGDCFGGVCAPDTRVCVECFNPAHCASGVCDVGSGSCVVGCVDDDVTEPNQGLDAATISDGGAHEGTICPGDIDELLIEAAGTISATLTVDGAGALQLRLLNGNDSLVATGAFAGDGITLTAPDLPLDTYRLVVNGANGEAGGDYLLSVDVIEPVVCAQLDGEPNNTTAQAPTIAADNALHAGSICGGDTDIFKFIAAAGDDVEAAAIAGDGAGTLSVAILNGAGTVVAQGNPATLSGVAGGNLFVRVTATGGDVTYSVRVLAQNNVIDPPVCNQTDAEPNDLDAQALNLTPGAAPASATVCPGDVDQFRFAATALDDAVVTVTGSGLTARLIRAVDGVQIASGLTINAPDLDAGGYRVVVEGATEETQSTYTVRVQLTAEPVPDPCLEDGVEPDSRTDARALALDGTPLPGRICAGDTDFFAFTLPFTSTVTVRSRFTHAAGDVDMRLVDAAGATITSATGVTDDEIIVRELDAGTYGVEVFGFAGALNTFTVEATLQGCSPEDGFEINNTFDRATPIAGAAVSGARCPGDDDFFVVRLENGDALDATLTGAGLTMSLVSSANGALLQSDAADGAGRRIQVAGLPAGRYVFRVTGSGAERVAYTLTPTISANPARCVDDGSAPNDTVGTAFALDETGLLDGSYELGSLVTCDGLDDDVFSIALPGQKQVALQMAFAPSDDLDIELLEARGTGGLTRSIARSVAVDKQDRVNGIVNSGGTFFIKVLSFTSTPAAYGIGIEVSDPPASSCVDDRFDTWKATSSGTAADRTFTNNAPLEAVELASVESFGQLRACPNNADWFKVSAAVGQTITVHVDYAHAAGRDIDVRLYGPASQTAPLTTCTRRGDENGTNLTCTGIGTDGTEDLVSPAQAASNGSTSHFVEVFGFLGGENFYDVDVTVQ